MLKCNAHSQLTLTCSKSTTERLEKGEICSKLTNFVLCRRINPIFKTLPDIGENGVE